MTIDAPLDAVPPVAPVVSPIASLLTAPILPTLLRLAIPNMIAMVGSTLVAVAETSISAGSAPFRSRRSRWYFRSRC